MACLHHNQLLLGAGRQASPAARAAPAPACQLPLLEAHVVLRHQLLLQLGQGRLHE